MLGACLIGFGVLSYALESKPIYPPVYFALGLTAVGLMVAYQVYRIRVLSRYYHKDPAAA